jgi:hypothetical protein
MTRVERVYRLVQALRNVRHYEQGWDEAIANAAKPDAQPLENRFAPDTPQAEALWDPPPKLDGQLDVFIAWLEAWQAGYDAGVAAAPPPEVPPAE